MLREPPAVETNKLSLASFQVTSQLTSGPLPLLYALETLCQGCISGGLLPAYLLVCR
jgi:hypothetical protein